MRDATCGVTHLVGARCALDARHTVRTDIAIESGHVTRLELHDARWDEVSACEIDLSGYLLMPGLVNAHDHLQFALHPRLGQPPYDNYIEWGEDIHTTMAVTADHYRSIPRDVRLWWGGIRNLLCGVTTVCHHDALWPQLRSADFPIRVVQQYRWAHSVALGEDLRAAHLATPRTSPFIIHACEGVDDIARRELATLEELGMLDEHTVLVHGLAIDDAGIELLRARDVSLIVCPSSNDFLFATLPDLHRMQGLEPIALGSDSPLSAAGDLLDEVRFAMERCDVGAESAFRMVTTNAASVLRLHHGEGAIGLSGRADLIAIRDQGVDAAEHMAMLSVGKIEFVMVGGSVQLVSDALYQRLPLHLVEGLEPLRIGEDFRWLRAPVKELLRRAEEVLGVGCVLLGGRALSYPQLAVITSEAVAVYQVD